jgi:hypothetical protein
MCAIGLQVIAHMDPPGSNTTEKGDNVTIKSCIEKPQSSGHGTATATRGSPPKGKRHTGMTLSATATQGHGDKLRG